MQHFPSITDKELQEACESYYNKASKLTGNSTWLRVANGHGSLSIAKRYSIKDSSTPMGLNEILEQSGTDEELCDHDNDQNHQTIKRAPRLHKDNTIIVDFSIILSPTYQVPVLWFTLSSEPAGRAIGIEAVYQCLVPGASRSALRQVGVIGAISIANHPVSDLPAFFIHPCNTAAALREICADNCSAEEYLMVWLGLVGPSVNLYMPSQLLSANILDKT